MIRIKQAYIASCVRSFEAEFRSKFELEPYKDPNTPAVFFGCYPPAKANRRPDISLVAQHRALGIVVWCGGDAMYAAGARKRDYAKVFSNPNIRHVAMSRFISNDLSSLGVKHIQLPICPTIEVDYAPTPLGPHVYIYLGAHANTEFYGGSVFKAVKAALPQFSYEICYSGPPDHHLLSEMPQIYSRCFIGLRLTKHDGLANTVVQLGLMGRRCIWNGGLPNCIPWSNTQDVVSAILEESKHIGETNTDVADGVRTALKLPPDWLHNTYWKIK